MTKMKQANLRKRPRNNKMNQDGNKHEIWEKMKIHEGFFGFCFVLLLFFNIGKITVAKHFEVVRSRAKNKRLSKLRVGSGSIQHLFTEVLLKARCHAKSCWAHKDKRKTSPSRRPVKWRKQRQHYTYKPR